MTTVDFKNFSEGPARSIVHSVGHLGENLVGLDLGTGDATNLLILLHNCQNISTIHSVDFYKPFTDYLKIPYDGLPEYSTSEFDTEITKLISATRRKYALKNDRIIFHEQASEDAVAAFESESLDFIFFNSYTNLQSARKDISNWYPKLKFGGMMYGNNWESYPVQKAVNEFIANNRIEGHLITYNNVWSLRKQIKAE